MKTQIELPEKVNEILGRLHAHGFEAFAVGGCIRDSLMGRVPKDWDITTSAKPLQIKTLFPRTIDTGLQHGTVTVMLGMEGFEVTTYRVDGEYEDARHPKEVHFTQNLLEDLKRRDFTVNAMAYNAQDGLVDAFGGADDLRQGVIRCVGSPQERFSEDALRMLRAVRFAAQLGFEIEDGTKAAIMQSAASLSRISMERIQAELASLITSAHPERMRDIYELGITKIILPEFDRMMQTAQNHPHHCYSVGEHTICSLRHIAPDKALRFTMLFHDLAKPVCRTTDEAGIDHFYGHPAKSAQIAHQIFRRMKFDCDTMDRACALIRCHDDNPPLTEAKVRRAVMRAGLAQYPALFAVKRADVMAQSSYMRTEKLAYIDAYEKIYRDIMAQGSCLSLKQLAVTGRDLLELGVPQGRQIGVILKRLLEQVVEEPQKNERAYLLEQAKQLFAHGNI